MSDGGGAVANRRIELLGALALGIVIPVAVAVAVAVDRTWERHPIVPLTIVMAAMGIGAAIATSRTRGMRHRVALSRASLDALVDHAPVGIAFLDHELRVLRVNDALTEMIAPLVAGHIRGRTLDELFQRAELAGLARSVLETGQPVASIEVGGPTARAGAPFHAIVDYYPVYGVGGTIDGVGAVVRDVTASVAGETSRQQLVERVTRLQGITEALAMATTTPDVVQVVLGEVQRATGAVAASLSRVVDGELEVVASDGIQREVLEQWDHVPVIAESPYTDAVRTRRLILAGTREEILERWPNVSPSLHASRRALAVLPLIVEGVAQGAVGLSFDDERDFGPDDETFFGAVATQCAEAMLRARLYESERAAHETSEAAAARLAFLAEASETLAGSLDWADTLRRVADSAVPRLADFAAVFAIVGDRIEAIEVRHGDPERTAALQAIADRWPPQLDHRVGIGAVARTGAPLLVTDVDPEGLATAARDREHEAALLGAGFQSVIEVPIRSRDRVSGLLFLATETPRRLDHADLALATELATRAGQALMNAELFRQRSNVAATLQASLLPPAMPVVPGLEVAARFFAVGEGIDVGGDFYDVFPLGTAVETPSEWAVVIGDVRGKGAEAATVSGAARHAIRAAALHETSPAAILAQLNQLLLVMAVGDPEPRFCTAIVGVVRPAADGATITLAIGGHPPPVVLRADGTTETVAGAGSLIGVLPEPDLHEVVVDLRSGDALVLYTDGVTERHHGRRFFDEEGLASVLSRCTGFTAPVLAERVETAARAFVEDAPRDDLAIVVIRAPELVAAATSASTELPGDVTAPMLGRRFVVAALAALGVDGPAETAALLASELVTNAVLHAAPPYRISVEATGGLVRVSVTDSSTAQPLVVEDDEGVSGRGMRLVGALSDRWGIQPAASGKTVWFELTA